MIKIVESDPSPYDAFKALYWYRENALDEGDVAVVEKLDRFIHSIQTEYGPYITRNFAVVVTDHSFMDSNLELLDSVPDAEEIELMLISIPQLSTLYNQCMEDAKDQ